MKKIHFHNADSHYTLKNKKLITKWIYHTISLENKDLKDISYIFCSDEYLININRDHLDHDTYTDIITFDYTENKLISSEIYISTERVKENAKNLSVAMTDEMHRVIIHGVLHLCGYKDKTKAQAQSMRAKEDYYLSLRNF